MSGARARTYTNSDMERAVARVATDTGFGPKMSEYELYRSEHPECGMPSSGAISKRYGSWNPAMEAMGYRTRSQNRKPPYADTHASCRKVYDGIPCGKDVEPGTRYCRWCRPERPLTYGLSYDEARKVLRKKYDPGYQGPEEYK